MRNGRIGLFFLFLLAVLTCTPFVGPGHAADRVALVIGNGAYAHATALPNPPNDAADMANTLREIGFEVVTATNVDKSGFDLKLRDFARALRGARTALFFYAGHGIQVAGRNYAVPVDARLEAAGDLAVETVDIDHILSIMQSDENRVNLVFLDACRDNPLTRSFARTLPATRGGAVGAGLSAIDAGRGTLIAFATAPHKLALDGKGRNSPFTGALLKHIRTPDLDIAFVMRRVTADVEAASGGSQVPWMHASLTSDVVLARSGVARPAAPAAPVEAAPGPARSPQPAAGAAAPTSRMDAYRIELLGEKLPDKTIHAAVGPARIASSEGRCFVYVNAKAARGNLIFYVSDYTRKDGRPEYGEVSIVFQNIPVKAAHLVAGGKRFELFVQNNMAWIRHAAEESDLRARLQQGMAVDVVFDAAASSNLRVGIDGAAVWQAVEGKSRFCRL